MKRTMTSVLTLILLVTSCKYGSSSGVKAPYNNLLEVLKEQAEVDKENLSRKFKLKIAKDIKKSSKNLIKDVNNVEKFSRKYYAIESKQNVKDRVSDMYLRINNALEVCDSGSLEIQKLIHTIGRQQYESTKRQFVRKVTEDAIMSEILTLYGLQYTKRAYETCAGVTYHYMNEFAVEKYDSMESVVGYRQQLLSKFFGLTGMLKVISKDSKTVLKRLSELKENNLLSQVHIDLVDDLLGEMGSSEQKFTKFTNEVIDSGLSDEMHNTYEELQKESDKIFANKTILFDPANPDSAVVDILVVLSNLTWGSVQTGLGLGIILTHAIIATPASWVLGAIFPDYFRPLRGPQLKRSLNGNQIYANVCGLPAIPSKMSMGIWELDFCAGYSFSSGHEGGHAKQSALLGPLYLPAAILSYTINGGHGGFIESWADSWSTH